MLRESHARSSPAMLALAAAAVLPLSGCSGSMPVGGTEIDQQQLQDEIADKVRGVAPSGSVGVSCPAQVPLARATEFTCVATVDDQHLRFRVTQTDDQGTVTYRQEQALLDLDHLETTLEPQLADQLGGAWRTVCEPARKSRYYAIAPGRNFECTTDGRTGDGRTAKDLPITVTVKDVQGEVTWTTK